MHYSILCESLNHHFRDTVQRLLIASILCNVFLVTLLEKSSSAASPEGKLASSMTSTDWPHWRGAEYNGISSENDWVTNWPEDGPPILWKKQIGKGFSSFSVVGERVYTMGYREKESGEKGDVVYCIDAETGKTVWEYFYACKLVANLHEGGPASTPTISDGRVYTVSKEGHFLCLDATKGKLLWERSFKDDLDGKMPSWGFSCSPLVVDDLVIVDAGRTAAFDRKTGKLVWKTEAFYPGYGSVVPFSPPDGKPSSKLLAVLNNDFLLILNQSDGKEVTRRKWTTSFKTSACTPTILQDKIFISTGYRRGCLLLQYKNGKLTDLYENKKLCNHMNASVLLDGCWYGFNGNSHNSRNVTLTCLDYKSGEQLWKQRGMGCGSLLVAGGKLLCLSDDGDLVVVEPSRKKFKEVAKAKVIDGKCWTVPVLSGGRVFIRTAMGDVVCVDLRRKK